MSWYLGASSIDQLKSVIINESAEKIIQAAEPQSGP